MVGNDLSATDLRIAMKAPHWAGTPATCVPSLVWKNSPHNSIVGRTPRNPSQSVAKAASSTTEFGVRWCGWRPWNSRNERKNPLAGRPRPRVKWERKTTRSPSAGAGATSAGGGARAVTAFGVGMRRVWRRNSIISSSTSEPSHTPERTAAGAAGPEELFSGGRDGYRAAAAGKGRRSSRRRRERARVLGHQFDINYVFANVL